MRISIFGLGYVGCVTAACLARAGHEVIGVDVNAEKVAMLNAGTSPIVEPGLGDLIREMTAARRLRATVSVDNAVRRSDVAMICVGTPGGRNGEIDTTAIAGVGEDIGRALQRRDEPFTVVLRSTVLPGTTEAVLVPALRSGLGQRFDDIIDVAVNPEFMREGTSLADFDHPPMTLVGCENDGTAGLLRNLYSTVDAPFIQTRLRVAEMTKYVSNAYHALKVCFANEIGDICEAFGVNAQEVTRTFLADHKLNVSEAYLKPGFAFGGSCLPKDLRALTYAARRADVALPLLSSIVPANDHQIRSGIAAVMAHRRKRIGVVGLAFKSGTDDLRESPMVTLIEALIGKGCQIRIFDSNVQLASLVGANRQYIEKEIPHISSLMCDDLGTLVDECEVLVIGSPGADSDRAMGLRTERHVVVDLTRGAVRRTPAAKPSDSPAAAFVLERLAVS